MDLNIGNNVFNLQKDDVNKPIRQPKPSPSISPTVVTLVAKAVSVSKLQNDKLIPIGKYGFALVGDTKLNYYRLMLYTSKNKINSVIENLVLTKDFKYNVNENNTVRFLANDNWFLEFANINDAVDFNSQLAFVLWKLNGSKDLFWIDLFYPTRNDNVAKLGNVVEITYFAYTIHDKILGPEVSNNIKDDRHLKVNINEDGWERSLLGVNEKTQRIVYIPVAEMGAWKILTDGQQSLCLTVTVKNVYEIEKNNAADLLVIVKQNPLDYDPLENNSILIQSKEIVDNSHTVGSIVPSKTISIELLHEEFEKLKIDNIKTNERLTKLEALVKEKNSENAGNLNDLKIKKSMKAVYKNIIREFPVDQTFTGSQIQIIIKDIFYNALMCANQSQSKKD